MDQKRSATSQETIATLRSEVERYANRRMVTPTDFEFLAQALQSSIQRPISPTTLKRVWGYLHDTGTAYTPGRYTLCTLARFIGYRDIEEVAHCLQTGSTIQSDHYFGLTIGCDDIPSGAMIEVTWKPNRKILLCHDSDHTFTVIRSEKAKLHTGDRVECHSFTQNAPLYIAQVIRDGSPISTYVAGARSGVRYRILPNSDIQ